jgi:hypothetical protein
MYVHVREDLRSPTDIMTICVDPEFRELGVGAQLLRVGCFALLLNATENVFFAISTIVHCNILARNGFQSKDG